VERKDRIDTFGAVALIAFAALLAFNQVVIKVVNEGLQPVFFAGVRSLGAIPCVLLWMWLRGSPLRITPGTVPAGLLIGVLFAAEFVFMFVALDLTTVARMAVIFYSMPIWLALAAHVLLPGERLTRGTAAGLVLAFAGVAWAILARGDGAAAGSRIGDLCALAAAVSWAGIALAARGTALSRERPEMQLLWQVVVSAPILLALAPLFGPFVRDFAPIHAWGLAFQIVVIVTAGFVFWLWLLTIYPAASVAAFSFLSPIFGVLFGWALLGEAVGVGILGPLALVSLGLWIMNRPRSPHPGMVTPPVRPPRRTGNQPGT
jgi:drug/metabolite transporter (DMT)-like permease